MADEVISDVADVVTDLEGDEQTGANVEIVADIFNQIDSLIVDGELNVTTAVSARSYSC